MFHRRKIYNGFQHLIDLKIPAVAIHLDFHEYRVQFKDNLS